MKQMLKLKCLKNDDSSICFTEGGIFIAINEEQCANALKPILVNED